MTRGVRYLTIHKLLFVKDKTIIHSGGTAQAVSPSFLRCMLIGIGTGVLQWLHCPMTEFFSSSKKTRRAFSTCPPSDLCMFLLRISLPHEGQLTLLGKMLPSSCGMLSVNHAQPGCPGSQGTDSSACTPAFQAIFAQSFSGKTA